MVAVKVFVRGCSTSKSKHFSLLYNIVDRRGNRFKKSPTKNDVIYQTRETEFHRDIQTPRIELTIRLH